MFFRARLSYKIHNHFRPRGRRHTHMNHMIVPRGRQNSYTDGTLMDIFFVVHYVLPRIRAYLIDHIRMICHLGIQVFFVDNLLAFQYFRSEPVGSIRFS